MGNLLRDLFLNALNMSITASYVIPFVIIVRLLLNKAPKIFSYSLWSVVLFRLVCPFSFSSAFSLLQLSGKNPVKVENVPSDIGSLLQPQANSSDSTINAVMAGTITETYTNPMQLVLFVLSIVWVVGIAVLLIYSTISFIRLKNQVSTATLLQNNVYECENISSPFVLGIIKPKIYLPTGLKEVEQSYILKHEQTHIRRFDYIVKLFAFVVLCIHWFNPLAWISFVLMAKDMEMSCDERVLKELGTVIKKDYSMSLLSLAIKPGMISASPLAFGESNVKVRIKNVLNYKKAGFWITITVAIVCLSVFVVCASNPKAINSSNSSDKTNELAQQLYVNRTEYVGNNSKVVALIDLLPLPDGVTRKEVELSTSKEPYGVIIHNRTADDSIKTNEKDFFKNSALLLATIDNADIITHIGHWSNLALSSSQFYYSFTRSDIEKVLGFDVREYAKSVEKLTELIEILNNSNSSNDYASNPIPLEHNSPGWSLSLSIGADMAVLDYASDDTVVFHGYFGLFVYDLKGLRIIRSLDLKPIKCDATQGDNYCEVSVSMDGNTVQLHPMSSADMYTYTVSDDKLIKAAYKPLKDPFTSRFVPLEKVLNPITGNYSYNTVPFNTGEYGLLHTSDWTLRTLSYKRGDMMYALFR